MIGLLPKVSKPTSYSPQQMSYDLNTQNYLNPQNIQPSVCSLCPFSSASSVPQAFTDKEIAGNWPNGLAWPNGDIGPCRSHKYLILSEKKTGALIGTQNYLLTAALVLKQWLQTVITYLETFPYLLERVDQNVVAYN